MRKAILVMIALLALIAPGIQASSVGKSIQEPKQATKPAEKQAESADNSSEPKQKPLFTLRVTADQNRPMGLRLR